MQDRLISALIYTFAGVILGIGVAITWAFHVNPATSSILIIVNTAFLQLAFSPTLKAIMIQAFI